jgi:RES domain-containing protein
MVQIEIPDDIFELTIPQLPGNWKEAPAPVDTRDFGTSLLSKANHPVLKIPSTVIQEEYNYLVNPAHPAGKQCRIVAVSDFIYDIRIKAV